MVDESPKLGCFEEMEPGGLQVGFPKHEAVRSERWVVG